uniref:Small ribosomal subunit protein mS25 n=1 Tax=Caenorhabditis japonica TaxID=281687 RepID=A0A8R1IZB9_CAEJA
MGFHRNPAEEQSGARDFVYWHWAQLQYHNPKVQLVKHVDKVITPFARAYLNDGREVLFDLDGMRREEIEKTLAKTLGKTELVERRERLESIAKLNPADFGSKNERQRFTPETTLNGRETARTIKDNARNQLIMIISSYSPCIL